MKRDKEKDQEKKRGIKEKKEGKYWKHRILKTVKIVKEKDREEEN